MYCNHYHHYYHCHYGRVSCLARRCRVSTLSIHHRQFLHALYIWYSTVLYSTVLCRQDVGPCTSQSALPCTVMHSGTHPDTQTICAVIPPHYTQSELMQDNSEDCWVITGPMLSCLQPPASFKPAPVWRVMGWCQVNSPVNGDQ